MPTLRTRGPQGRSRGQAEVLGGLIVLTLVFAFAVPLLLNSYFTAQKAVQEYGAKQVRRLTGFNERLTIQPVNPASRLAQAAGWIPGVFINNTGTVPVTLDKLYLIDTVSKTVYAVLDFRYLRPGLNPLVKLVLVDVTYSNGALDWRYPPPAGEPVTLKPGENVLIVFSESLADVASRLVVRVESATGLLHPVTGGGAGEQTLSPAGAGQAGALWRGIYYPQSGFQLKGASELLRYGEAYAWVPPIHVYLDYSDSPDVYYPAPMYYYESFIYDDPDYPGLYKVKIVFYGVPEWSGWDWYARSYAYLSLTDAKDGYPRTKVTVYSGWTIELRGFIGTYHTGDADVYEESITYFNGFAFEVIVRDERGNIVYHYPNDWGYDSLPPIDLGSSSITQMDFDGNGVQELVFYSLLNGPTIAAPEDIDADGSAVTSPEVNNELRDSLVWTYMVARDISGVDYIRVTVKINYYWTTVFTSCPGSIKTLKIFSVAVLRYDNAAGRWVVYHYQSFGYTNEKPKQFQPTVTFPVDRSGTYRVAVMFYDNYRDWDYLYYCYKDFTFTLEHLIVEYGIVNPYFKESPPVYIVAIPDPDFIKDLGEYDYMNYTGIDDLNTAKVEAQERLLNLITSELNYAGVTGYTVITDPGDLYRLLISNEAPPKYAVIFWLQGSVTVTELLNSWGYPVGDSDILGLIRNYHWVWVWVAGEPLGDSSRVPVYLSYYVTVNGPGSYNLTITSDGEKARGEFYAFYLTDYVLFNYTTSTTNDACIVNGTAFYANTTASPVEYGTVAYWASCSEGTGALLLNPVHIDWDRTNDGAPPETVAQQAVYAALYAWNVVRSS